MIRSMTGYGSATASLEGGTVTVEARSVNSRGLKVVIKAPPGSEGWESELRQVVESRAQRGRIDLFVRVEDAQGTAVRTLDEARVRELLDAAARLRDEFGVPGELDVASFLQIHGLIREGGEERSFAPDLGAITAAAAEAVDLLIDMRDREGSRLEADLRERLEGIAEAVAGAETLAPERLERERARLQAAVVELAGKGLDEERLAREIALIADRWDVGEELVRARSHLEAFAEFLEAPIDEPVGKRLGFLVQELQREINTLGAKANDVRISRLVVEAKNEIEKLREQVENVE